MREIKFRGKSVKNCEWLYGYLFPRSLLEDADYLEPLWIASGFENECMAVDTESIGQYTGLHDKNGKEIYEGDIIRSKNHHPEKMEVRFLEGGFCAWWGSDDYPIDINHFYDSKGCCIEIIGNIHENPELLEERE